jgi:environmental stress-induced protein Ves
VSSRVIPPAEWKRQPWKNGGGVTFEIARWPDTDDYDVRVSVAEITERGPFSRFPGYDRYSIFLGPKPIELMHGRQIDTISTPGAFTHFLGDTEIFAVPSGPTRFLNIIARRGIEAGLNVPAKPVRFAFELDEHVARVFDPPERVSTRVVWIA